jgi:opacity protein-like surface antigen
MKKSLLAVLLAVAMVAPVFAADEGAMELDIKAGFNLMSNAKVDDWNYDESVDPAFTAGVDFFYYVIPQLAVGAGVQYVFNSELDKTGGKAGWTNLYAQAKYVFDLGDDLFNNIYPLVQIGYGILRMDPEEAEDSNGIYWGIGVGTTIKENFLVELLYSNNNASVKNFTFIDSVDLKYSTLQLKVGYKFVF